MVTRALTRAFRVPRNPVCHRCSSTSSRQPAQSTPRSPKPSGQTPRSNSPRPRFDNQKPRFDGPKPKSDGSRPRPDGQKPRFDNPTPKPAGQKSKGAPTPRGRPFNTSRGPAIFPIVTRWAHQHNVGFPDELKSAKLKVGGASIQFKHSPRQVFRPYHVPQFLSGLHQNVLTEYQLYKYGEKLVEPLWVHITGSYQVKPVVRNFARRRLRQGLFAALAERGYTPDGRVAEAGSQGEESGGKTGRRAPGPGLKGTISLQVTDPIAVLNLESEMHLEIGREIVKSVESKQSAR